MKPVVYCLYGALFIYQVIGDGYAALQLVIFINSQLNMRGAANKKFSPCVTVIEVCLNSIGKCVLSFSVNAVDSEKMNL